jgi:hypothetical protein
VPPWITLERVAARGSAPPHSQGIGPSSKIPTDGGPTAFRNVGANAQCEASEDREGKECLPVCADEPDGQQDPHA